MCIRDRFPPALLPRKVDLEIESGEYFLSKREKQMKKLNEQKEKQMEREVERQEERAKNFVAPQEEAYKPNNN